MTADVARALERLTQQRGAQRARLEFARQAVRDAARQQAGGILAGDPVFDTISGTEGVIVGRTRENLVVPTATKSNG